MPWIQEVLADRSSSYRLRFGVLSALNAMRDLRPDELRPPTITAIIDASVNPDSALRAEAHRFLANHPSWKLETELDRALTDARRQMAAGSSPSPRVAQLARSDVELLYNLGVIEKDLYGSCKPEDRPHIEKSIAAFEKASKVQPLAAPNDRIVFTKALYGWGHALHDRSWIGRRPDGTRDPVLVRAAQDKFSEFLREVQRSPDPKAHPYPNHLKQAEAYLKNPEPKSLR